MKFLLGFVLGMSGIMVASAVNFRIDLQCKDASGGLVFKGGSEGISGGKAGWLKDKAETRLIVLGKASEQWQEKSFQFVPKKDGEVSVQLMADPVGKKRPFVAYDNIRVEGAVLANGGFETYQPPRPNGWWSMGENCRVVGENAPEGKNYVEVSHNDRFFQHIKCKAGELVTVTFLVRDAKRETEVK